MHKDIIMKEPSERIQRVGHYLVVGEFEPKQSRFCDVEVLPLIVNQNLFIQIHQNIYFNQYPA